MIHSTVPPEQVNRATVHATVSELWHVLSGRHAAQVAVEVFEGADSLRENDSSARASASTSSRLARSSRLHASAGGCSGRLSFAGAAD
jgi:hypothetical protein